MSDTVRDAILDLLWDGKPGSSHNAAELADAVLALIAPADSVVLSREERSFLAEMVRTWYGGDQEPSMAALAARLDAFS